MVFDLACPELRRDAEAQPWARPETYWPRLAAATAARPAPLVAIGLEALSWNAHELLRRASGVSIRVASKSVRVRQVLDAVLALPGYRGVLAYSLAEALWLSDTIDDVVVGYPTADRAAIAALAGDDRAASRVTLMIDSVDQLDLIDAVAPPRGRAPIRLCLDLDASWQAPLLGHIGVLRSPVREPTELRALAQAVLERPGWVLAGVMSYEAQIAGVADRPAGRPLRGALLRAVQRRSLHELRERRAAAVAAVCDIAPLEFVNGGGTGSLELTAADPAITEVAAGSGLYGSHLFDHYAAFTPAPAAAFALDVVRRPRPDTATVFGGGWLASGSASPDRLPQPVWPRGLSFTSREGAGEVQSPLQGAAARELSVGDRVWLRHAKAGEIMEHANEVSVVRVMAETEPETEPATGPERVLTYRGEGKCFS